MTQNNIMDSDAGIDHISNMSLNQLREFAAHMWKEMAITATELQYECPSIANTLDNIRDGEFTRSAFSNIKRFKHFQCGNNLFAEVDNVNDVITIFNTSTNTILTFNKINENEMPIVELE